MSSQTPGVSTPASTENIQRIAELLATHEPPVMVVVPWPATPAGPPSCSCGHDTPLEGKNSYDERAWQIHLATLIDEAVTR